MLYRENGQFKTSYQADQQIFPIAQDRWGVLLLIAFAFVGVPLLVDEYMFRAILIPFLILSLAALGVNLLVGYCGQITLGAGAFMAVGAYAAYNFLIRVDGMPACWRDHPWRCFCRRRRHRVRCAEPARARSIPRRGDAGGTVLLGLGFPAHQVVHQRLASSGNGFGLQPQCDGLDHQLADRQVPVLPDHPGRVRWRRRTWCVATWAGNGWRSATWTSRPR
jgi:hypothetical protein